MAGDRSERRSNRLAAGSTGSSMQEAGLKDPTPLKRKINEAERQRNERDGGPSWDHRNGALIRSRGEVAASHRFR